MLCRTRATLSHTTGTARSVFNVGTFTADWEWITWANKKTLFRKVFKVVICFRVESCPNYNVAFRFLVDQTVFLYSNVENLKITTFCNIRLR